MAVAAPEHAMGSILSVAPHIEDVGAESASDTAYGVSRFVDAETARLRMLAATWRDFQQMRKALVQRDLDDTLVDGFERLERLTLERLKRSLRQHPLWPWLAQFPGLGGGHTAIVIATIGDPRRFPGQACSIGHIVAPLYEIGSSCPLHAEFRDESEVRAGESGAAASVHEIERSRGCPGTMLAPRTTTGVRSVWHYLGLHVDSEGRSPRKRKGVQATWHPTARASLLQPDGIADQIVRHRVEPYRGIYDAQKARLTQARGAVDTGENDQHAGAASSFESDRPIGATEAFVEADLEYGGASPSPQAADVSAAIEPAPGGLRPFQIDALARKIAVKAFVGDLLVAWKELC